LGEAYQASFLIFVIESSQEVSYIHHYIAGVNNQEHHHQYFWYRISVKDGETATYVAFLFITAKGIIKFVIFQIVLLNAFSPLNCWLLIKFVAL